jgi:hypothetical protein
MFYRFHLFFYCPNSLSELVPGNLENARVFLEDLASQELQSLRRRVIITVGAEVDFNPGQNLYILHFRICCLYSLKVPSAILRNIEAVVEARLSLALLELFGDPLPLSVENIDG